LASLNALMGEEWLHSAKKNPESQNLAQWGCVWVGILGWIISGQLPS